MLDPWDIERLLGLKFFFSFLLCRNVIVTIVIIIVRHPSGLKDLKSVFRVSQSKQCLAMRPWWLYMNMVLTPQNGVNGANNVVIVKVNAVLSLIRGLARHRFTEW